MPAVRSRQFRRMPARVFEGVPINVGDSWSAVAEANPVSTVFLGLPGTHSGANVHNIIPKSGQQFLMQPGCILNGSGTADKYCFLGRGGAGASDVVVSGGRITNFAPPWLARTGNPTPGGMGSAGSGQLSAVWPWNNVAGSVPNRNWRFESMEIDNNETGGVRVGDQFQLLNSYVHHNRETNITGGPTAGSAFGSDGRDAIVAGCEVSYGNYLAEFHPGFEAGGSKFVLTTRLKVGLSTNRPFAADIGGTYSNWFHHNTGPGIWTDINNLDTEHSYNISEDNASASAAAPGIFHEVSYAANIHNNLVRRNRRTDDTWAWSGQILIAASPNVNVYDNIVIAASEYDGIVLIQQNRDDVGTNGLGDHLCKNISVHDNDITLGTTNSWSGLVSDYTARNAELTGNSFNSNVYHVPEGTPGTTARFMWIASGLVNWSTFRSTYGQEALGTID